MISILIAYDNEDFKKGEYFTESQKNLVSKLETHEHIFYELLDSQTCSESSIDLHISKIEGKPFLFIGYMHGNKDALLIGENEYVNSKNAYFFGGSIFYACSCFSARSLGKSLIDNGCKIFLGYNSRISCVSNETEPIFYHCENAFISHFLTTENSIQKCLSFMYDEYERLKTYLVNNNQFFDASVLESNLNAFELLVADIQDYNLRSQDFNTVFSP